MIKRRTAAAVLAVILGVSAVSVSPVNAEIFSISGDVNSDGEFNIADVVKTQKWLISASDSHLENWKAADMYIDGRLDVYDLCLLKRKLISSENRLYISSPSCKAAAFACVEDREYLYYDRINERVAPASLTKLLTASVALHYLEPDTVITVGPEQNLVKSGSSLCLISRGQRLKLYDLLTGMLIASGNDAAYTVAAATARAVSGVTSMNDMQAVAYFAELMNKYAATIGMTDSHFVNPEGWDNDGQYTTVSDLIILADHAFNVPEIRSITGTYQKKVYFVSGENITWTNTNALLASGGAYYCSDAVGMKTGTTANAGNCLIAVFKRNGKTYISVVVGCPQGSDRYEHTLKMLSAFA